MFSGILARLRNHGDGHAATPVHCTLTSEKSGRRILLHPITAVVNCQRGSENSEPWNGTLPLMVSFRSSGGMPSHEWTEWLLSAPRDAKEISLSYTAQFGGGYPGWIGQ